jgi:peroxiredoxin
MKKKILNFFFDLTVADPDGTEKPLLRGIPGNFFPQCTTSEVPQCNTLVLPFN